MEPLPAENALADLKTPAPPLNARRASRYNRVAAQRESFFREPIALALETGITAAPRNEFVDILRVSAGP